MRNILVIKNADFSANAVEQVDIYQYVGPTISIGVGGVVTITASVADGIYYTTDGSTPTASSTQYSGTFNVAAGTTVKAISKLYGKTSLVASKTFNAGGSSILYKLNYTLGFPSSDSSVLTEIALSGYAISDYIPVPAYSDLNINYGANVQTMGMWDDYYKFKIVEYDAEQNVVVSTEARENVNGSKVAVGSNCIWSIRDGANNIAYKNIPTQQATRYIKIVVKLGTSANVVDKSNNECLFQYIPD